VFNVEESNAYGGGIHTSIGNNDGSLITSFYLPNMFGKGEKLSAEYTYGTRNHTDYRLAYFTPIGLNPHQK
jgi:outer membrane protein insertion porin family